MQSPDDLDRVIDEVAREMIAGDAGAGLRARVLADIDRPRRFAWRPLFAAACALGAAAALLFAVSRGRAPSPSPGVPQISASVPQASPKGPEVPPTTPQASPNVSEASPKVPQVAAHVPRRAAAPPPENVFAEEPLTEDPIVVERITIAPINPGSIAVLELPSITPIAVAPIGPGEQR